jgi:cysteine-rich repeat protein
MLMVSEYGRKTGRRMSAVAWALGAMFAALLLIGPAEAAKPVCGDNRCNGKETFANCPLDCPAGGDVCGDGDCTGSETCSSCAGDCGICPPAQCNFDGICNLGEDCLGCPSDCLSVTSGKPSNRYCCGADTCDSGLCGAGACTATQVCGNGLVEGVEECDDGNLDNDDGCDDQCLIEVQNDAAPDNQFNIGDSIGEAEAANGTIGSINHQHVWSTGYDGGDVVDSVNERFEAADGAAYYENNSARDGTFNHAVSGAEMADFAAQATEVVAATAATPTGDAGMVTIMLGGNDVCAPNMDSMTDPAQFEAQYRAGLDVLAEWPATSGANIHVSSIPAIYWLWNARRSDTFCRYFVWPFVPCQNLLNDPGDDCESVTSRLDPDNVYPGDGSDCRRRKEFHARIRDVYNPIIQNVLAEYRDSGALPNSEFVDIFDVPFSSTHVNSGDCFHPSRAGHALLAEKQWCRSKWGVGDAMCTP